MKISSRISVSFFGLALILTSISSSCFFVFAEKSLKHSISSNLAAAVIARTQHVETYLEMLTISAAQLSKSVVLENFLKINDQEGLGKDKGLSQRGEAFGAAMKRLRRTKAVNPEVAEFLLMNRGGTVVASSEESSLGQEKSSDSIFLGGMAEPYVKDVYYSEVYKEPLVAVSVPFLDSQTKEFLGVLAVRVRMKKLNEIVEERTGLGATGEIYIVNKYGYLITPSRFKNDVVLKFRMDIPDRKQLWLDKGGEHVFQKDISASIYHDYRGILIVGEKGSIPELQWTVMAEIDESEAFRPLAQLRLVFLCVLFIVPLLTWFLGKGLAVTITSPLRKLRRGAEIIGEGNLDYKTGIETEDEVGQLSQAFDAMTEQLKISTVSLGALREEILERKRAERELGLATKRMEFILGASKTGLDIVDAEFNMVYMDPEWAKVYGDWNGKKCYEYFLGGNRICEGCGLQKAFATKKTIVQEEVLVREGNRSVQVTSIPFQDENGKWFAAEVNVDITERKKKEEMLRLSEERFHLLMQNTADFVWLMDLKMQFIYMSASVTHIHGYDYEEALTKKAEDLVAPESIGVVVEAWNKEWELESRPQKDLERSRTIEIVNLRKNGTKFLAEVKMAYVRDREGKATGVIGITRDITERKQVESELIKKSAEVMKSREILLSMLEDNNEARKELLNSLGELKRTQAMLIQSEKLSSLGQLVSKMAHEVNNPLMIISGNAQLSLMEQIQEEDVKKNLEIILSETNRAKDIIQRLLLFSRPSKEEATKLDINQVLHSIVKLLGHQYMVANAKIIEAYAPALPEILVDEKQIQQVVINLIKNAAEAMPQGGAITIKTTREDKKVRIDVRDDGQGISKENQAHLFEPFFSTKEMGTGLGLAVCYGIIKGHGGEILVESEVGKGTTFSILLPVGGG